MAMVGMAVMGRSFAQNFASKGFDIAMFNRTAARTVEAYEACKDLPYASRLHPVTGTMEDLVKKVGPDGTYLIMVQAGEATESMIQQLKPLLAKGAVVVDCANSRWTDTVRHSKEFEGTGIDFFGAGVSGGEEGALRGPAIMPGGPSEEVYNKRLKAALEAVSAKAPGDGQPCVTYIGKHGAGHFVKMVHNGIEYGDMELIAEAYDLMSGGLGMTAPQMSEVFGKWNKGILNSYLIEISAEVLGQKDAEGKGYLVDRILDEAQMKGTGTWTIIHSLDLESGVEPLPTTYAAVESRAISAKKADRAAMSKVLPIPRKKIRGDRKKLLKDLEQALYVAKIASYTQGISLMQAAAKEYDFGGLNIGEIARIWRAGCIIRAGFLDDITQAYKKSPDLLSLMAAPLFKKAVEKGFPCLQRVCIAAAEARVPCMAFDASRNFILQAVNARLPANLTQAQRDFFGAHTYKKVDAKGRPVVHKSGPNAGKAVVYHTHWMEPGRPETTS
jgi:6-phosphogluconate dehydrogenase